MKGDRLLTAGLVAVSALLGVAVVVDNAVIRLVVAGVMMLTIILAIAPVREIALLGWFLLAPYWQEVARSTSFGTALNNGAYLFAGVGLVLWAIIVLVHRGKEGELRGSDLFPGLLVILAAVSLALTTLLPSGWTKVDLLRQLYANLILPVGGFYVLWLGVRRGYLERWYTALWATSVGVSLLVAMERLVGWQLWSYTKWQHVDIGRSVGPLANPAVLGTFLGMAMVSAAAYLIWSRDNRVMVRWAVVAIVLAAPALWFTYARASLLAVVAAVALIAALKSEARATLVIVILLVVVVLAGTWGTVSDASVVSERFGNVSNAQVRVLLAAWSVELAMQRPLMGWGYGSFDAAKSFAHGAIADIPTSYASSDTSHNTVLTMLVELGLAGVLLLTVSWLPYIWRATRLLFRRVTTDWRVFACLAVVLVFWVNAVFIDMRFFSLPVLLAWMALGGLRSTLPQSEPVAERSPQPELAVVEA